MVVEKHWFIFSKSVQRVTMCNCHLPHLWSRVRHLTSPWSDGRAWVYLGIWPCTKSSQIPRKMQTSNSSSLQPAGELVVSNHWKNRTKPAMRKPEIPNPRKTPLNKTANQQLRYRPYWLWRRRSKPLHNTFTFKIAFHANVVCIVLMFSMCSAKACGSTSPLLSSSKLYCCRYFVLQGFHIYICWP